MANNDPDKTRYEVITQESNDGSGDLIIPIPAPMLKSLGWTEETELAIGVDEHGKIFLMSKEDHIILVGKVIQVLPNARFKVELENGHILVAYIGGKMRKFEIRIILGDEVQVEISPYDLSQGRIIRRN